MKRLAFIFTFALISTLAIAQRGHRGPAIEQFKDELNLTAAQLDELAEIKTEIRSSIEKMRSSNTRPTHEERAAFREAQQQRISAVLTTVQLEKLEALKGNFHQDRKQRHQAHKEKSKAKHAEIKAYHEQEIMPVLLKQRAKLEKDISRKDRKEIAQLRIVMTKYKAELKSRFAAKKAAYKATKETQKAKGKRITEDEKRAHFGKRKHEKRKRKHGEHRFDFKTDFKEKYPDAAVQLESLEKKYEANITNLLNEIESEKAQWKAKRDTDRKERMEMHSKRVDKSKDCKKGEGKEGKESIDHDQRKAKHENHRRIGFLLLDPNKDAKEQQAAAFDINQVHNTNVFPNPATNDQTIEFDVVESGNVLVEVIDKNGKVIRQIHNGTMNEGTQRLSVDVSDLKGFVFYYRITDAVGTSSTKFMTKN